MSSQLSRGKEIDAQARRELAAMRERGASMDAGPCGWGRRCSRFAAARPGASSALRRAPLALAHEELPPPVAARVQLAAAQRATRENSRRSGPEPAPEPAPEPRPGRKLAVLAVLNRSCGWAHAHRVAQQRIGTALHHL